MCHYGCGATFDLRPYGPGGALVCFDCATATPERERATGAAFGAQLEAAEAMSPYGTAVIGGSDGPNPLTVVPGR